MDWSFPRSILPYLTAGSLVAVSYFYFSSPEVTITSDGPVYEHSLMVNNNKIKTFRTPASLRNFPSTLGKEYAPHDTRGSSQNAVRDDAPDDELPSSSRSSRGGYQSSNQGRSSPSVRQGTAKEEGASTKSDAFSSKQTGSSTFRNSPFRPATTPGKETTETKDSSPRSGSGSSSAPNPTIRGTILPLDGLITQNRFSPLFPEAYATVCTDARILLFDLANMSILLDNPITGDDIPADTSFEFNPTALGLNLTTPSRYLLQTHGCLINYQRIISSFYEDQSMDQATTLLSKIINTSQASVVSLTSSKSMQELYEMVSDGLASGESIEDVWAKLDTSPILKQNFQTTFQGTSTEELKKAAPDVSGIQYHQALHEKIPYNFSVSASHWLGTYVFGYEWQVDGVVKETTPAWVYTPSANSPATQTITLILGHKNFGDSLVDRTVPYHRIDFTVTVADDFPVSAPTIQQAGGALSPLDTRAVDLEVLSGALVSGEYSGCETFTDFAITESMTPPAAGDFSLSCTSGPLHPITYNVQSTTDGAKTLRIWARDNRGQVTPVPGGIILDIDTTDPVIDFHDLQASYNADTSVTFYWRLTETHASSSQHFDIEFNNGSTWVSLPQVPVTAGPHSAVIFSTTYLLPNLPVMGARLRVTYEDTLGQQTIATSDAFNILIPVLGSAPMSLDLGNMANKSTSAETTMIISNSGGAPSKLCSSTMIGGTHATEFTLSEDNCLGTSIAAGGNCVLKFRATPDAKGARSGDFTITCGNDSYTSSLGVNALNNVSTMADVSASTAEETAVSVTLGATTDLDGDTQTFSIVSGPFHGAISACAVSGANYVCTYTPGTNYNGTDTFTFKANDGTSDTNTAAAAIAVNNSNDVPVIAATQSVSTSEETTLSFTLNAGTDGDSDTLSYIIVSAPGSGALSCTGGTSTACTYTPAADYVGSTTFTYKATDGTADSNVATVTVTVSNVNDPPLVGANQPVTTPEDTSVNFTLNAGSDIDLPAQTISYKVISEPTKGVLSNCIDSSAYSTDRTCTYTPNSNETGIDTFTYRAYDTVTESSLSGTVTITLTAANDAPVVASTQAVSTAEDAPITFDLAAGTDIENDALTYIKVSDPASGSLTCTGGASRSCSFTPALNFHGTRTFTYKTNDGSTDSNVATVTITVTAVNDAPVKAANQTFSIDDNSTLAITLSPGTDVDGDTLTYKIVSAPTNGTLSNCISTGGYGSDLVCDYVSNANFNGADSFMFVAYDGNLEALSSATVTITVNDNTPAPAPLITLASAQYTNSLSTTFTASDCTDTPFVLVNEGAQPSAGAPSWHTCSTSAGAITFTLSNSQGAHTARVWSKDAQSNVSSASTDFTIYYDSVVPAMTLTTPTAVRGGASFSLAWTATESYTTTGLNFSVEAFNGTTWSAVGTTASTAGPLSGAAFTRSWSVPSLNVSNAAFRVSFADRAGNSNTVTSGNFAIDSTPPATTITSPASNSYHLASATITGVCESGRDVTFSGGIQATFSISCATGSYSQLVNLSNSDGTKTINVTQEDAVGNSTTVSVTLNRDEVAPMMTKTIGASPFFTNGNTPNAWGGTCEGNYTISVTGDETTNFNCSSGSWSWVPSAKTSDGTFTYNLVQTDAAGNTSAPPLALSWERDATPPTFTVASPFTASRGDSITLTNNLNVMTLSGSCERTNSIAISGSVTETLSCSSASWEWTMPTYTTDGTRSFTFTQNDSAGNPSVIGLTWTRNTSGPALKLSSNLKKSNESNATFSGTCEPGINVSVSGPETATVSCPVGTWTFTSSSYGTDSDRTFVFTQTFTTPPFNATTVNGKWIRETNLPTLSGFTTLTPSPSRSSFIPVNITATSQNPNVYVSHICIRPDSTNAPAADSTCFIGVNSPEVGQPLAQVLNISNYYTLMGWTPKGYDLYVWVKDEAGNISALTEIIGTDRISMSYNPGIPPTIWDVAAANVPSTPLPPTRAQSSVPAGTDVYIRWNSNDNLPLPSGAISLYYTTDEITFNLITSNLNNDDYGCGLSLAPTQGCYRWVGGSPLNTAYKVRVRVTDSSLVSTQLTSNPVNFNMIKIIAGNTESGLDGSAQTAMFFTKRQGDWSDPGTLVVSKDGRFFFADHKRGIITVDQADGKQKIFIRATGVSSGDGGAAVNATLSYATKVSLDYQNRLVILDDNRIRRVDLKLAIPTIETIIGGGSDTGATVANPLNVSLTSHASWDWYVSYLPLINLPNGDIIFRSEYGFKEYNISSYRIRIYKASNNSVISKYFTGLGNTLDPNQDVSKCRLSNPSFEFNTANSQLTRLSILSEYSLGFPDCYRYHTFSRVLYDPNTFQTLPSSDNGVAWWHFPSYTGMDGKTYLTVARNYIARNDWNGSYPMVIGNPNGAKGECADGTVASACMVDIQNIFVTPTSKMYFTDRGMIRTVDDFGNIKTLFGQKLTYGHNVNALNARFSDVSRVHRVANGKIILNDRGGGYIKEFTPERNISIIVGDGSSRDPILTNPAATEPFVESDWFAVDKVTGSVFGSYLSFGYGSYIKLNRGTGLWERIIGNETSGPEYQVADGEVGLAIRSNNGERIRSLPIAYDNGKLIANLMSHDGVNGRWSDMMVKSFDASDSYRQAHMMGVVGFPADNNDRRVCDATTPVSAANCEMPHWDTIRDYQWDSIGNRWIFAVTVGSAHNQIYEMTPGGNIRLLWTTLSSIHLSILFKRESGNEIIYYCNSSRIRKVNLTSGVEEGDLPWSMPNLSCRGSTMSYNASNNSIIFPFEQNGLNGVAEYFLP